MKISPYSRLLTLVLMVFLSASGFSRPGSLAASSWTDKIDPRLKVQAEAAQASGSQVEFLITLREQADLSGAASLKIKQEKSEYVFQKLTETANRTQPVILKELASRGIIYRAYWIANLIWARGDWAVVQALAQRRDVARLDPNPQVRVDLPTPGPAAAGPQSIDTIEWNITKVGADQVWALGDRGQGVVIGGQDTGYQWDHPALKNQYRGWNGFTADHNYNWHDSIHQNQYGDNSCGFNSQAPCDDYGHGTHTMGTMVGDDGNGSQIGMAPEAKWIGCRNMDNGYGSPVSYTECFQWFLAPTDLNDQNPDPSKAPDVISNSWGCPSSEGCNSNTLLSVVENVRAAGIVVVVSAGNKGPGCSSVIDPPGIYDPAFTVGSTTSTDGISSFSSRGPVTVDGSGRIKPDISAPGSSIRSSIPPNQYGYMSGTSMAAPHVAGLVALLISYDPSSRGQVNQIENLIEQSAVPLTTTQTCGGVPGQNIPNNTFGWGRIDAYQAVQQLSPHELQISKSAFPAVVAPGQAITYTLEITHITTVSPTLQVVLTDTLPVGTTFLSATEPFTLTNDMILWNFPSLEPGAARAVKLVVQAPEAAGEVNNQDYGVKSAEAPFVRGLPVITPVEAPVFHYYFYLPLLLP